MPNAECRMPNAECRMPNAECRMPNTECRMPNADFRIPGCPIPPPACKPARSPLSSERESSLHRPRICSIAVASGPSAPGALSPAVRRPYSLFEPIRRGLRPSRDLYCIDLTPVPNRALEQVSATLELNRIPSPFGANVTRDGLIVYAPVVRVTGSASARRVSRGRDRVGGLDRNARDGSDPEARRGHQRRDRVPKLDWPTFFVLITAETKRQCNRTERPRRAARFLRQLAHAAARHHRIPVRRRHRARQRCGRRSTCRPRHASTARSAVASWIHPPMPRGLAMMPAEMKLPPPDHVAVPAESRGRRSRCEAAPGRAR